MLNTQTPPSQGVPSMRGRPSEWYIPGRPSHPPQQRTTTSSERAHNTWYPRIFWKITTTLRHFSKSIGVCALGVSAGVCVVVTYLDFILKFCPWSLVFLRRTGSEVSTDSTWPKERKTATRLQTLTFYKVTKMSATTLNSKIFPNICSNVCSLMCALSYICSHISSLLFLMG